MARCCVVWVVFGFINARAWVLARGQGHHAQWVWLSLQHTAMIPPCALSLFHHYTGVWRTPSLLVTNADIAWGFVSTLATYSLVSFWGSVRIVLNGEESNTSLFHHVPWDLHARRIIMTGNL
jgi:hypothetical protein